MSLSGAPVLNHSMNKLSPKIKAGGALAALIMFCSAAVMPLAVTWIDAARLERQRVESQIDSLSKTFELLVDAETGQRGYIITGMNVFLQPYHVALMAFPTQLRDLSGRFAEEDENERKRVDTLLDSTRKKLEDLARTVDLRQREGFSSVEPIISKATGKQYMDEVRGEVDELTAAKRIELAKLDGDLQGKVRWAIVFALTSTAVNLVLLGWMARSLFRAFIRGQSIAAEAKQISEGRAQDMKTLERRNVEVSSLAEMARTLQTDMSLEESLDVASLYCERLLSGTSGAIYLLRNSQNALERAAVWGPECDGEELQATIFEPSSCWGLRRGQVHRWSGPQDLPCRHCTAPEGVTQLCLPLQAFGEPLGLLVLIAPADGSLDSLALTASQIAEQLALTVSNLRMRQMLRNQSIRDPLTGLYNRSNMEETLSRELARSGRNKAPLAIVMIDLDHFKKLNDTHGHHVGDAALVAVAGYLNTSVRTSDVVCRYGGEELLLILPDCTLQDAVDKAWQLCTGLRTMAVDAGDRSIRVTASFGVAGAPQHSAQPAKLIEVADRALYEAKHAGRDRVAVGGTVGTTAGDQALQTLADKGGREPESTISVP